MFYKFIDKSKAKELSSLGFKYKIEQLGENEVYSFFTTPELINYVSSKYEKKDYFVDKVMKFN